MAVLHAKVKKKIIKKKDLVMIMNPSQFPTLWIRIAFVKAQADDGSSVKARDKGRNCRIAGGGDGTYWNKATATNSQPCKLQPRSRKKCQRYVLRLAIRVDALV